ncbi:MAG: hypothetical protein V4773_14280, partial [Verrucomicrobiota bacterium]
MVFNPRALFFSALCAGATAVYAQNGAAGTRELTTDRPDTTETPFTIEPGKVQLETSVATWSRDRLDGVRTTEWEIAPFNVRIG